MKQQDPTSIGSSLPIPNDREITVEELQSILASTAVTAEPTIAAAHPQVAAEQPSTTAALPIPIPLPRRAVSGRYRSAAASFQLELRVDVDGRRPLNEISGDFYQITGGTTTYFGSFIVASPTLTVTPTAVTIKGLGRFTFAAGAPVVQVTIPRVFIFAPPPAATVQFFTMGGVPGATYVCAFESSYFRTVRYERGRVSDVATPEFLSYNTASFPSGGPNRTLSVQSAYAEAGVEIQVLPEANLIDISEAPGAKWTDAELEASMQLHFDQFQDVPQWAVWEVVCQLHELGPGLLGIMFDYQDAHQRQGCAVFHAGLGGITNDLLRLQLYTYVHELGHCFNLMHSWQKSLATPPGTDNPSALSWMNYPWRYPGGVPAFWNAFPFQFIDSELAHIRHAFRNDVIMGANPFGTGAGLEDPRSFADPVKDESGLRFQISAPRSTSLGEPLVLQLKLATNDARGKTVHNYLHPSSGLVRVAIQRPNGQVHLFQPIMEHCVSGQQVRLDTTTASIEDSAYIGYGKNGLTFDQTGSYKIRATYYATDGSQVVSNAITHRVRHPMTAQDESVADLLLGNEQGALLALLGSDSKFLQSGNKAFDEILERHATHPLAAYVRLAKGVNAGRQFKTIIPGEAKVSLRAARHEERIQLLSHVEANASKIALDPITLDQVRAYLAESQRSVGEQKEAADTEKRIKVKAARGAAR